MNRRGEDSICRVAAWGLPGAPDLHQPAGPEEEAWLVDRAVSTRLPGVLLAACEAGAIGLSERSIETLVAQHRSALLWCLHLEHRLLELCERFDRAGDLEFLVVKGSAVAHLDELDPALRSFADIDLLVHGADLDRVVGVLLASGASRPWAQRRAGYDRRFAKSVTLTMEDRVEVDVHRSLCDGAHGFRIDLDALFLRRASFELGGRSIPCPGPTHRMLHAAYHLLLGSAEPALMNLRDLARHLTNPAIDREQVIAEVRSWRGEAVLAGAIEEVRHALGIDAPGWYAWAAALAVSDREQAIIDRQRAEGSALSWGKVDALRELPRVRDQLAFGLGLLWPSREHLRSRGMTRREMWR